MDILIWLIVGSLLGRVAGWVLETHDVHDILFNVVIGSGGALLGGWLLTPWLGEGPPHPGEFHSTAVAVSLIGAALLIGTLNLMRSDAVH
jgi:uncharacterized membrane protein YeaQ/YmgE (transglycosylase-associated protein family)